MGASVAAARRRARTALRRRARALALVGRRVQCPCCSWRFRRFPVHARSGDTVCPRCGARPRHRLLWLYLEREVLADGAPRRVLHLAPEWALEHRLRAAPGVRYLSADLDAPGAMVHFDLAAIPYPEASFDLVLCSHVLEHVPDDAAALAELHRVLRPGGEALVLVPQDLARPRTLEDPAIVTPEERQRHFWGPDHVRLYGADLPRRLERAGFAVERAPYPAALPPDARRRHDLRETDVIWRARRAPR